MAVLLPEVWGVCVTGCVIGCKSTKRLDDGTSKRVPRQSAVGYLCQQCHDRLAEWLGGEESVAAAYAWLPMVADPGSVESDLGAKHGTRSTAPVPIRMEVLDHTDQRHGWRTDGTTDRRGTLGLIESWGRLVREERHMQIPTAPATVSGECAFLLRNLPWIAEQRWVDEFYAEIRQHAKELDTAIGHPWPTPIGSCPSCSEPLWMPPDGGDRIECRSCGAYWTRERWLLLADVIEDEADHGAGGEPAGDQSGRCVEAR